MHQLKLLFSLAILPLVAGAADLHVQQRPALLHLVVQAQGERGTQMGNQQHVMPGDFELIDRHLNFLSGAIRHGVAPALMEKHAAHRSGVWQPRNTDAGIRITVQQGPQELEPTSLVSLCQYSSQDGYSARR